MAANRNAANPFLQLPDVVLRHIHEFEPITRLAATSKSLLGRVESCAKDVIHQLANGSGVDANNWTARLSEYCHNELRPPRLPPGIEATAPFRLLLRAAKFVPVSSYVIQPDLGVVQIQQDGTLVSVCNGGTLRVLDTTTGTRLTQEHLPWIPKTGVMSVIGDSNPFADVLYIANGYMALPDGYMVLHHKDMDVTTMVQQHTIYSWSLHLHRNQHNEIHLSKMFQDPLKHFSSAVTTDGKLVVVAFDYSGETGGKVVCVDIATNRHHPTQDLHELLSIQTDGHYLKNVVYEVVRINDRLFLLRYSEAPGQNGATGVYLLTFNEGGSLSVGSFRRCFEGVEVRPVNLVHGHHSGWSKSNWLVYRSFVPGGSVVKALSWTGSLDGTNAVGHDIPFKGNRQGVLLVVGDRLIAQGYQERDGDIKLDEVCIRTGKVLRTITLSGRSRSEYKVSSVVATKQNKLVCILSNKTRQVDCSVVMTFVL